MVPYFQINPNGAQQTVNWPHSEPDVPTKLHKNPCQYLKKTACFNNSDLLFDCCSRFKNACIRIAFLQLPEVQPLGNPNCYKPYYILLPILVKSTVGIFEGIRTPHIWSANPYQASFRGCRVCLRKNFLCCVVSYGITKCRCTHDLGINTLPSSVTIRYNLYIYIYIMYSTVSKIVSTIRIKLVQPHLGSYLVIIWFISRHTWAIPSYTHTHNSPFSFQN